MVAEEISTLSFMRITSVFQETTENVRVTVMPFYLKKSDYVSFLVFVFLVLTMKVHV